MDLSVRKKGRERDVIVVVVVCERGDTQVHLIQMLTMGMGVGSRWGGERGTPAKVVDLVAQVFTWHPCPNFWEWEGGREAQRGIDLFLKCKFEE